MKAREDSWVKLAWMFLLPDHIFLSSTISLCFFLIPPSLCLSLLLSLSFSKSPSSTFLLNLSLLMSHIITTVILLFIPPPLHLLFFSKFSQLIFTFSCLQLSVFFKNFPPSLTFLLFSSSLSQKDVFNFLSFHS